MMVWIPFLMAGLLILVANAAGFIDLDSHPVKRVFKWLIVAAWAWFLPVLGQQVFHFKFKPELLNLWQMLVLGVLLAWILTALIAWIWRFYGPAPEGSRRCAYCRKLILKVMLECPHCRKPVSPHDQ